MGLDKSATASDIKKKYYQLSKDLHPDKIDKDKYNKKQLE